MGRLLLTWRLAIRDIERRRVQSTLLLLMIVTTTTTLTIGLALHKVTVAATGGPYPIGFAQLTTRHIDVLAETEGRDVAPAAIDRPALTAGRWVSPGGAVIERGFADALGLHVGDAFRLGGHGFRVAGIAVSTAQCFYPVSTPGVIWLTRRDTEALATSAQPLGYILNLKLDDPSSAVLLAENLLLALAATAVGVTVGELLAPVLTNLGSGLLGSAPTPPLTVTSVGEVLIVAVLVAACATIVPAIRGTRTSTIRALNDPAHPPRRRPWLIALSARLPGSRSGSSPGGSGARSSRSPA
jgi:hypothetical protein